ncbi:hypothetical protein INR75_13435 [Zunongwangia sp. SCSIO 43204]|uniref:hypothetical protein n=1 Tax=Zunongwangia sp. SCSIO 43204 TaxID=2779359 RepID=UPI001CA8EF27|nr:hypothetical protein [Zunongwangia sp. SCSIO 43204]UAB83190.1 hypothetical protein INR75_13435 [Zunongwangia sp. SCSIO 43204]
MNDNSSIFLTGATIIDMASGEFTYRNYANEVVNSDELDSQINFSLGVGYRYNKFQAEIKYFTNRDLMRSRLSFDANYKNLSFILGYTLF